MMIKTRTATPTTIPWVWDLFFSISTGIGMGVGVFWELRLLFKLIPSPGLSVNGWRKEFPMRMRAKRIINRIEVIILIEE